MGPITAGFWDRMFWRTPSVVEMEQNFLISVVSLASSTSTSHQGALEQCTGMHMQPPVHLPAPRQRLFIPNIPVFPMPAGCWVAHKELEDSVLCEAATVPCLGVRRGFNGCMSMVWGERLRLALFISAWGRGIILQVQLSWHKQVLL